jgi:hypothetical protein
VSYSYPEAKEVLYSQNRFSFSSGRGVIRFHSLLPPHDWQLLRHLHISTLFRTPMSQFMSCTQPPESYNNWKECCRVLSTLSKLDTLTIEMTIWNGNGRYDPTLENDNTNAFSIIFIFESLMKVKARTFRVESNIPLSTYVKAVLPSRPFEVVVRARPFDFEAFWVP